MRDPSEETRPSRLQEAWQWGLGMLSRGRTPVSTQLSTIVDDVSRAEFPMRGSTCWDRVNAALMPAVAATHRFLEITAGPAGLEVLMLSSLAAATQYAVQASAFRGSTVANLVTLVPETVANVSQHSFGNPQFPGPAFFFTAPRGKPYSLVTGTCGQLGPIILAHQPAVQVARELWLPESIILQPSETLVLLCSVPNLALDLSFVTRVPMRASQAPEGF